jgi:hypothetical protein
MFSDRKGEEKISVQNFLNPRYVLHNTKNNTRLYGTTALPVCHTRRQKMSVLENRVLRR